jgi:dihydroxyacid dehydratase/phosphogluconate dehydratase
VRERRLDLLVDDAELAKRRAALKPTTEAGLRGYDKLFRESVMQAPDGCDFAFLRR